MTDMAQWEPDSMGAALDTLDRVRAYLQRAEDANDVALIRDQGEAMAYWARERDMGHETEMIGQEIARRAERKLGELLTELREAGKVRGAGRPRKNLTSESEDTDGNLTSESEVISPASMFDSQDEKTFASKAASIDDDTYAEALAEARKRGDVTRKGVTRVLREMGLVNGAGAAATEDTEITPIGRVMSAVVRNLASVVEELKKFEPSTIEHEKRKEWNAAIREHVNEIEAWRKALPR